MQFLAEQHLVAAKLVRKNGAAWVTQGGWQHVRPASGYSWRHPQFGTERQIDHIFLSASLVPRRVEYLWEFERLALEGTSRKVGRPDHAMLVCEFDQAPESAGLSRTKN